MWSLTDSHVLYFSIRGADLMLSSHFFLLGTVPEVMQSKSSTAFTSSSDFPLSFFGVSWGTNTLSVLLRSGTSQALGHVELGNSRITVSASLSMSFCIADCLSSFNLFFFLHHASITRWDLWWGAACVALAAVYSALPAALQLETKMAAARDCIIQWGRGGRGGDFLSQVNTLLGNVSLYSSGLRSDHLLSVFCLDLLH